MSFAALSTTIYRRFYQEWQALRGFTDAQMTTRVSWPNVNFTRPANASWVRYTNLPASSSQATLGPFGGRTYRTRGLVIVQVFTPDNSGAPENNALCEDVISIFRGVTADGVRYSGPQGEAPRVRSVGNDGSGWFQQNVECPWMGDAFH